MISITYNAFELKISPRLEWWDDKISWGDTLWEKPHWNMETNLYSQIFINTLLVVSLSITTYPLRYSFFINFSIIFIYKKFLILDIENSESQPFAGGTCAVAPRDTSILENKLDIEVAGWIRGLIQGWRLVEIMLSYPIDN